MQNFNGVEPPKKPRGSVKKVGVLIVFILVFSGVTGYLLFKNPGAGDLLAQGSAVIAGSWNDMAGSSTAQPIVSEIDMSAPSSSDISSLASAKENSSSSRSNFSSPAVVFLSAGDANSFSNATSVAVTTDENDAVQTASAAATEADETSSAAGPVTAVACSTSSAIVSPRRIILNEIAWMGSVPVAGETAAKAANREWIELKNISGGAIALDGWQVTNASGRVYVVFGGNETIAAGALFLLSRDGVAVAGISPDKTYSGTLANGGDKLFVFDPQCGVSDVLDASTKWPGGDNTTKQTLERKSDLSWQTSAASGGTPRAENSAGMPIVVTISSSTEKYDVSVAIAGDGGGKVTMKPDSIVCKTFCTNQYAAGATVTLAASASSGVSFLGWSGGCSGSSSCSFVVGGPVSVIADFRLDADDLLAADDEDNTTDTIMESTTTTTDAASETTSTNVTDTTNATNTDQNSPPSPVSSAPNHLLIAAVQIAGAESGNDFVKIYNPTSVAVDVSGWKLRKKSSTGTDASLREFPVGSSVAAGAYFVWANSADGFAQSIGADASSTGTLAANNSAALFDENGKQIDAVAWGTGTNQYVEGAAYPTSPTANQVLERKSASGVIVDTDNNANDFTL